MMEQDKIKIITEFISDRSRLIQDELDRLDPSSETYDLSLEILAAQLSVLDEVYNEINLIKNQ